MAPRVPPRGSSGLLPYRSGNGGTRGCGAGLRRARPPADEFVTANTPGSEPPPPVAGAPPAAAAKPPGAVAGAVAKPDGEVCGGAGHLVGPRRWLSAGFCDPCPGRSAGRRVPPAARAGRLCEDRAVAGQSGRRIALGPVHLTPPKFSHRGVMRRALLFPRLALCEGTSGLKSTRALRASAVRIYMGGKEGWDAFKNYSVQR